MKMPKRGEKGFTLVELLIVLAILAVLAAVVIPNVTGMFGRGASQAYDTDEETIQMAVATFYFDIHDMSDDGSELGHWYPTADGDDGTATADAGDPVDDLTGFNVIYMGLLVNTPALTGSWAADGNPADGEKGPYLNEIPKSASTANGGEGSYTWTIGADGKVFGFLDNGSGYTCGFSEVYP